MRKLTAVAFAFTTTFAMANNGQEENANPSTTQQTEQTLSYDEIFKRAEDEAIYCEVTRSNGDVVRCVLCNCKKLADEAQKN